MADTELDKCKQQQEFLNEEEIDSSDLIDCESNSNKNSHHESIVTKSNDNSLCNKKRKLKSLDDIVRKITKHDVSESRGEDDLKLSDRLQTLDQTLRENEYEEKKENPWKSSDGNTTNYNMEKEKQENEEDFNETITKGDIKKESYGNEGQHVKDYQNNPINQHVDENGSYL